MSRFAAHRDETLWASSRFPKRSSDFRIPALGALAAVILASCQPALPGRGPGETGAPPELSSAELSLEGARAPGTVSFLACGDVLLSRAVARMVEANGYRWPFRKVRELVSEADLAFCNLENPASFVGTPYPGKPENVTFRAPPGTLFGLKWAGFDAVSLANNHMNDYGGPAILETLDFLDMLGIARAGAGADEAAARAPAVLEVRGVRVAILAYAEQDWSVLPAGKERPGVALADAARLAGDIAAVRERERPDYIVVSVHWGAEHTRLPGPSQRAFGRAAIDAGAVLVLGHHPHVLQPLEKYGPGLIAYSLGNFVFDMAADSTYDTAALRVTLSGGKVREAEIVPLRIERRDYAPRRTSPEEARRILEGFAEGSRLLGTAVKVADGLGRIEF